MKYQKPYIVTGPNKPYIVPDSICQTGKVALTHTVVKSLPGGWQESRLAAHSESTEKNIWNQDTDLPPVFYNSPL